MKKISFVNEYSKRLRITQKEGKEKIEAFWEVLESELENEQVKFKDFGVFEIKESRPRKVVTPKVSLITKGNKKIKFRPGKGLKKIVRSLVND